MSFNDNGLLTKFSKKLAFIFFILFAAGLSSCAKKTEVTFSVKVKTNQGNTIPKASIKLGDQWLGDTDQNGEWSQTLELAAGEKQRLEISKKSDRNYYAPDFMDFTVNDEGAQKVTYEATLYFVPKPSPKSQVANKEKKPAKDTTSKSVTKASTSSDAEEYDIPPETDLADEKPKLESAGDSTKIVEKPSYHKEATDSEISDNTDEPNSEIVENIEIENPVTKLPTAPKLTLSKVIESAIPDNAGKQVYPKPVRKNKGSTVFTVHAWSGKKPLAGTEIFLGRQEKGDLKIGCKTNKRGRCVIRFKSKPKKPIKFIARKSGFFTEGKTTRVKNKGLLRFDLKKGETIDIFAITRKFNFTEGLKNVAVYIDGKNVGTTDRYGHFSYQYQGNHDDLLEVSLRPRGYLPEEYQTDFVVSGPMSLTKYFMPKLPPPAKMTVLRVQPAGVSRAGDLKVFDPILDAKMRRSTRSYLFSSKAFKEVSFGTFDSEAKESGLSLGQIISSGWQTTDLKSKVDAIILPTIVMGRRPTLELSVIDSRGWIIAAGKEELESLTDQSSIDQSVTSIVTRIIKSLPFEGVVTKKNANTVDINIGSSAGRRIKVGDTLDVYGTQSGLRGTKKENKKIGTLVVTTVLDQKSVCKIKNLIARATIGRGDQVVMVRRSKTKAISSASTYIQVVGKSKGAKYQAVTQANVYYNGEWVGATEDTGKMYLNPKQYSGVGILKVIKHGYSSFSQKYELSKVKKKQIRLSRETAFIRVESTPTSASVSIDGKFIGKTPLSHPVPVPSGFVKIQLKGVPGYKIFSEVMELEKGTLDLTGNRKIRLEVDYRKIADRLLTSGKVLEAVNKLNEIPKGHTDYLIAQHQAGEIYLTMLNQPAKAAAAFGSVTSNRAVKQFNDKRFIGSHIDEGIALFLTAKKLVNSDKAGAVAHYQKAVEILEGVTPFLRFVPKSQYPRAVHNVSYYKALSRHRIWQQSANKADLAVAVKNWREYLEGSAKAVPLKSDEEGLVENARIYFKQAKASMVSLR